MQRLKALLIGGAVLGLANAASAATQKAYYGFNNTLSSSIAGAPDLVSVDPLGLNGYSTATVFGSNRTVFDFRGANVPPTDQGGLSLDSTGLVGSANYSVVFVLSFDARNGGWRRILDVQNRQSDQGFYVDPLNSLDVFPVSFGVGSTKFTTGNFHSVVLTNGGGNVSAYLDGGLEFAITTPVMDIANPDNPGNLLNFFLDNTAANFQDEWSSGSVANIRLYDGVLSAGEVDTLWKNPFAAVPEPGSWALMIAGFGLAGAQIRRRRSVSSAA